MRAGLAGGRLPGALRWASAQGCRHRPADPGRPARRTGRGARGRGRAGRPARVAQDVLPGRRGTLRHDGRPGRSFPAPAPARRHRRGHRGFLRRPGKHMRRGHTTGRNPVPRGAHDTGRSDNDRTL
ncbi:hypothetical protein B5P43_22275 [Bacillus sp. SRB_336]|nr:hypothetical protein B5P43_22275 [Bacillus sp. SRB_336]